jgi:hypothetical protein
MKNDLHFAAQAADKEGRQQIEELKRELLEKRGFKDDTLAFAGAVFPEGQEPFSMSCPIIEIHVSKHPPTKTEIGSGLRELNNLMKKYNLVSGYAHGEKRLYDVTFEADDRFSPSPWRLEKFQSKIRREGIEKKWDIHATVPRDFVYNNPKVNSILKDDAGFYFIDVKKIRNGIEGIYRVYTIQGVNNTNEGEIVFDAFFDWAKKSKFPRLELCLEKTIQVCRYNNPQIVPPTIDKVRIR